MRRLRATAKRAIAGARRPFVTARAPERVWAANVDSEIAFWRRVLGERVATLDSYKQRATPAAPLEHPALVAALQALPGRHLRVLDVGSGPLTALGRTLPGKQLEVVATDPLADEYLRLLDEEGIEAPSPPVRCAGEELLERFEPDSFDLAYARNSLDHAADPLRVIANMLTLIKPGRVVYLEHLRRVATENLWRGLHQWDFDCEDGRFVMQRGRRRADVGASFAHAADVRCEVRGGWVVSVLVRRPGWAPPAPG